MCFLLTNEGEAGSTAPSHCKRPCSQVMPVGVLGTVQHPPKMTYVYLPLLSVWSKPSRCHFSPVCHINAGSWREPACSARHLQARVGGDRAQRAGCNQVQADGGACWEGGDRHGGRGDSHCQQEQQRGSCEAQEADAGWRGMGGVSSGCLTLGHFAHGQEFWKGCVCAEEQSTF